MKNFFVKNKALLVVLLAALIALANYLIYPVIIKNNMSMTTVCIANTTLQEGTKITEDMLEEITTSTEMLPHGIYLNKSAVVGKYIKPGYTVPENGLFYAEYLQDEQSAMGSSFSNLSQGKVAYTIEIDKQYNSNNTLKEGQYIELYYSATDEKEANRTVVGILDQNVKIISISPESSAYYLTVEINYEDIVYYTLAQSSGTIIPIVSFESNRDHGDGLLNDTSLTRQYLLLHNGTALQGVLE